MMENLNSAFITGYEKDEETNLDFAQARMYVNQLGRFSSPDDFMNDTDLDDPQSFNKYIYVRNNPLNLIDPTGKKADINITYDQKTKTYNITVTAKFGVYVASGKLSQKQINKQIELLKSQLKDIYTKNFSNDKGFKANLSLDISVKQYSSESAAVKDANAGKIDNIVGLVKGSYIGGGEPGARPSPDATGRGYRVEGENFDRMLVATDSAASNATYAHEFGHLLSAEHLNDPPGLMNRDNSGNNNLNAEHFNNIFSKYLDKNNQSETYIYYKNSSRKRLWYGTVRANTVYKKKSTIFPR